MNNTFQSTQQHFQGNSQHINKENQNPIQDRIQEELNKAQSYGVKISPFPPDAQIKYKSSEQLE